MDQLLLSVITFAVFEIYTYRDIKKHGKMLTIGISANDWHFVFNVFCFLRFIIQQNINVFFPQFPQTSIS